MHGTLNFILAERQLEVLARLRRATRPGGRLVLLFNISQPISPDVAADNHSSYVDFVLNELKRLDVPLPDSEAIMRERFQSRARQRELRDRSFSGPGEVEALVSNAGFRVHRCTQMGAELAGAVDSLLAEFSKQRFMLIAEPNP
jgi:hypothetical protein